MKGNYCASVKCQTIRCNQSRTRPNRKGESLVQKSSW